MTPKNTLRLFFALSTLLGMKSTPVYGAVQATPSSTDSKKVDFLKDVQLQIGALGLFGLRLGVVAGLQIVLSTGGELLDAFRAHMMIGESQAIRGNERS